MYHKNLLASGKIYPDRTFSIGVHPRKKKRVADSQYERDRIAQLPPSLINVAEFICGMRSITPHRCSLDDRPLFIEGQELSRDSKKVYGENGITNYGKKVVNNAALLLQRKHGRRCLGFVTCTLPSYSEEVHRAINGQWSEITRRFYQKLKRHLKKQGKEFDYVGVVEIQEKRFDKYNIPCPHLHFVYVCKDNRYKEYYASMQYLHRFWNEAVQEGIKKSGVDCSDEEKELTGSVHAQIVKKSAAGYLGKYMSKGCSVVKKMKEKGWKEFPKQWWTAAASVKKAFKDAIVYLDTATSLDMLDRLGDYVEEGVITWFRLIEVGWDSQSLLVGMVGKISSSAYKILTT